VIQYQEAFPAAEDAHASPAGDRAATAVDLIALSDNLQKLGYPYEAYQMREAAARLRRDLRQP
jgi:hypothetical protein